MDERAKDDSSLKELQVIYQLANCRFWLHLFFLTEHHRKTMKINVKFAMEQATKGQMGSKHISSTSLTSALYGTG